MTAYMAVLKLSLLNTNTDDMIYEEVRAVIGDRLVETVSDPYWLNGADVENEYYVGISHEGENDGMNPVDLLVIATREVLRKRRVMFRDMIVSVVESRIYPLNADLIVITHNLD